MKVSCSDVPGLTRLAPVAKDGLGSVEGATPHSGSGNEAQGQLPETFP